MKNRPLSYMAAYPIFHFDRPVFACALAQNNRQLRRVIPAAASRPCYWVHQLLPLVATVLLASWSERLLGMMANQWPESYFTG